MTGVAGTGKSFCLNFYLEWCRANGKRVALTATTGIAALNIGGKTLHSFLGLRPGQENAQKIAADERWQRSSRWAIRRAQILVIDEISMASKKLLDLAEELCRLARDDQASAPWGGLQIVFVGDMGQLPPVELETDGFAFQSAAWAAAGLETHDLQAVMRQKDAVFVGVLQEVRLGKLSAEGRAVLGARVRAFNPDDPATPAVRVMTHNAQVDQINAKKLSELPGEALSFKALDWCASNKSGEFALARLQKDCLSPAELRLRLGARVMFTRNSGKKEASQYVNGSTGTVVELKEGRILVKLDRGGVLVDCQKFEWAVERDDQLLASRTQYPLKLSWAATCHKTQGMTLDRVSIDLTKTFAPGQAYVALSRCRTLEGLNIEAWRESQSIFAHACVLDWIAQKATTEGFDW